MRDEAAGPKETAARSKGETALNMEETAHNREKTAPNREVVLVTGGSGRLGRSVVAGLAEAGYAVISVDR